MNAPSPYSLLDSGDGEKLERFGPITLIRPSSVCLWRKRNAQAWKGADSSYVPERGWTKNLTPWAIEIEGEKLELRLQDNGQIGFFPEHSSYLSEVRSVAQAGECAVLNLFAYTGLASLVAARTLAKVTHVDLSKKALSWFERNIELNELPRDRFRFVLDDAIKFASREARRGARYDIVIADPPSFSRTSKEKFWKLETILRELADNCAALKPRLCILTCHDPGIGAQMLANIISDSFEQADVSCQEMSIAEQTANRALPAGSLAWIRRS